jgi:hypothetical protein
MASIVALADGELIVAWQQAREREAGPPLTALCRST